MKMINGAYYEKAIKPINGNLDWNYFLITTVKEYLKSIGLAVFVFTLLNYLVSNVLRSSESAI
jgi:hypothetical protein